ncbi:unnamed protein product [Closterium sp. NIES-53]
MLPCTRSALPCALPACCPALQPARRPAQQPERSPALHPARRPALQPARRPALQLARRPALPPARRPGLQPSRRPALQPARRPALQPARRPALQPARRPALQPMHRPALQPARSPAAHAPCSQCALQLRTSPSSALSPLSSYWHHHSYYYCHCLPWPLPLSYVSGSRVCRSLSRRSSFVSGLSGGATLVAELAVLELEVLVLAVLVLDGRRRSYRSSFANGLSGGAAPVAEPGVLLLEVPVSLLLLVVPLVDAEVLGVDSSGSIVRRRLSPQQLREWAVRWGSPGGGAWGTSAGGVEAPGGVEATSLGACDSASAGVEPKEALHTIILDSGASRCFFRDITTVTPLTTLVPVTLADPSEGPVVARGANVLPCPVAPSGLLIGLHLPSFPKNLVATSVLQDQWVNVTQPGGELVVIYMDARTGEHLATFTRRPGSGLYTLTTESALVAESGQVAASVEVAASCSCRLLTHQTLLWHHRLGHPSLPHLRGMHSVSLSRGFPGPCPRSRAPLQTLHMDVWAPARVPGQGGERYFLLVVDDYTRYTTVFPLQSKAEDLPVLRLHSDRGGEFSSGLLGDFCGAEGICQTFMLPASPQQNGIAERCIGLVMEVARTSIVHAAAPHFLWPFAWTGEVGDASPFRIWGALSLVRDPPAGKLSPRALRCVFLGFPTDAPGWQFYHPGYRRVLSSRDVTFDESVCFYRLHPHRSSPVPLSPLALVSDLPPVAPHPPLGPAPSGVSQVHPPPLVKPLEVSLDTSGPAEGGDQSANDTVTPRRSARLAVPPGFQPRPSSPLLRPVAVDSSAAEGGDTGGADSGGAGSGGAASAMGAGGAGGATAGGSAGGGAGGAGAGGAGARRQENLSPEWLREWAHRWGNPGGGAWRARAAGSGGAGLGGASAGVPGVGCARGTGAGGTVANRGTGGAAAVGAAAGSSGDAGLGGAGTGVPEVGCAGVPGAGGVGAAGGTGGAGLGGTSAGVPGVARAGGTGTGGIGATGGTGGADTRGTTGGTGVSGASRQESLSPLQLREWAVCWGSPGGGAGGIGSGCDGHYHHSWGSVCVDLHVYTDLPSPGHDQPSLPPLSPLPTLPCLPYIEGRQRAAPHSSSFPPTSAPLQTLHMDMWGPARVGGQDRELYFLLVVDDYTCYTTVFPLRSKGEVPDVFIPWIRAVRLQLCERFREDLPVLRLHSDRGGDFSSNLLRDFCRGEGIL